MDLRKTLSEVSKILEKHNIEFALIGGFALAAYSINRATYDIDFLVYGSKKDHIKELLLNHGFKIDFESPNVLQFSGPGFVDFLLANKELSQKMIQNAKMLKDFPVLVVQPEDIIGLKIQAYNNDPTRELRDKADIYEIMRVCKDLDINKIKMYADIFKKWDEIQELWNKK